MKSESKKVLGKRNKVIKNYFKIFTWLLISCVVVLWTADGALALTAKDKYMQAEAKYRILRKMPKLQKYRDKWLFCIKKYNAVYRHDPAGAWAAAGLYKTGELYLELYKHSYAKGDERKALAIFRKVIKLYPASNYKKKAEILQKNIVRQRSRQANKIKLSAKKKYLRAEAYYRKFKSSSSRQKYRDQWLAGVKKYEDTFNYDPFGSWAPASLFMMGKLYHGLYRWSAQKKDMAASVSRYKQVIEKFPQSEYSRKAVQALAKSKIIVSSKPTEKKATERKKVKTTSRKNRLKKNAEPLKSKCSMVSGLRYWSNPSYTRIVIDADQEVSFKHHLLKKDLKNKKPQRLYIDLKNARLGKGIKRVVPINDNLLSDARAGQYSSDFVRVVVEIKSFKTYKIFSLKNPFRIVVDVWGIGANGKKQSRPNVATLPKGGKLSQSALAKQLALGVRRIVIDPGHGGRDYGAPGYIKGVHEKHIVLQIARRLAKKIREKLHCEVILTRTTDKYISLEERTAIANTKNADLFISIHTNAARNKKAYGCETFFLNLATDDESILVAARENATSTKNISDLQSILNDLMQNAKINESSRLAEYTQSAIFSQLKKNYSRVKNKGVKQAPFYVLLGAQMPAILIETSFISNPRECKRLINAQYQDQLCEGIVKGIRKYIKETNPTAFLQRPVDMAERG